MAKTGRKRNGGLRAMEMPKRTSRGGENIGQFFQGRCQGSEITSKGVEYGIVVNPESAEPSISPQNCTASGKAHVKSYSANALTAPRVLLSLAGRGHDLDCKEFDDGNCAIARPINTAGSDTYSVAVSMPARRFTERLPLLRESLKTCRGDVELAAGAL
jgi:hypothetical protein